MPNTEVVVTKSESDAVEEALASLGFDLRGETDPAFMADLMKKIGLPKMPESDAGRIVQQLSNSPIPLSPLKKKIVEALMQNEPLKKTILEAKEQNLHLNKDNSEQIKSAIHFMVILEVMTTLMANDGAFSNTVMDAMLSQRGVKNPGNPLANLASITWKVGDLFAGIKAISVDPGMWMYRCWRDYARENPGKKEPTEEYCKKFIKDHKLKSINASRIMSALDKKKAKEHRVLRANVTEAVIAQPKKANGECNQMAGFALTAYLEETTPKSSYELSPTASSSESPAAAASEDSHFWKDLYGHKPPNNLFPENDFPQEWVNLYESWNMAFVMNKFPDKFHLLFPKLLIPATLGSKPEHYMAYRVPSLWLTINFITVMSKNKDPLRSCPEQPDTRKLLTIWNTQNFEAGQKLMNEIPLRHHYETQIKRRSGIFLIFSILSGKQVSKNRDFAFDFLETALAEESLKKISNCLEEWAQTLKNKPDAISQEKKLMIEQLKNRIETTNEETPQQKLKNFYNELNANRATLTQHSSTKEVKCIYKIFSYLTNIYTNWRNTKTLDKVVNNTILSHYNNQLSLLKQKSTQKVQDDTNSPGKKKRSL